MKFRLTIITFFSFFSFFGQIQNGKIEYNVNIEMLEGLNEGGALKRQYTEAVENAKYLSFTLLFDKENALFSINEGLGVENTDLFMTKLTAGYINEVYQKKEFSLSEVGKVFGNYLLKKEAIKDWELVNETKEIEGFLCYKATSTKVVVNPKGTFKFPIIAWYCPKIPLSFGPNGYGNLPGLILELQVRNVVYGVKKIDLNLEKPPILKKIKDYKIINQEEYDEIIKQNRDNYKNAFIKPESKF